MTREIAEERSVDEKDWERLFRAAEMALQKAIAPYSQFRVGAAVLCRSGEIYTGCNIEVSSYGLTICAERVALFKALSEGEREFAAIAVVTEASVPCPPCGACRQVIWDFAPNAQVGYRGKDSGGHVILSAQELFPRPFEPSFLGR